MAMSRDRVEFKLRDRYFQKRYSGYHRGGGGMERSICQKVLLLAFGIPMDESDSLMDLHPTGFKIRCRPSQFARFIVYRNEIGECINGVKDLNPKLVTPVESSLYTRISEETHESIDTVGRVLRAMGVPDRMETSDILDVSKRFEGQS